MKSLIKFCQTIWWPDISDTSNLVTPIIPIWETGRVTKMYVTLPSSISADTVVGIRVDQTSSNDAEVTLEASGSGRGVRYEVDCDIPCTEGGYIAFHTDGAVTNEKGVGVTLEITR
jgi:hypothetical protein